MGKKLALQFLLILMTASFCILLSNTPSHASTLDSIQAAILNVKLARLDEYAAKRRTAADFYDNAF